MIEQRTEEWRDARAGKITASVFADCLSFRKDGNPTADQMKLIKRLAWERLNRKPVHEINAAALWWGREVEEAARQTYEIETGNVVKDVGFITHPDHTFLGASPDGLVGTDGGLEMKCPHDETVHLDTLMNGMPEDHIAQVQGGMLVTGRKWWSFVSFDPRCEEQYRFYHQVIERDDNYINSVLLPGLLKIEMKVREFIRTIETRDAA